VPRRCFSRWSAQKQFAHERVSSVLRVGAATVRDVGVGAGLVDQRIHRVRADLVEVEGRHEGGRDTLRWEPDDLTWTVEVFREHPRHVVERVLLGVDRERGDEAAELPFEKPSIDLRPCHALSGRPRAGTEAEHLDLLLSDSPSRALR
jgi:hypothetical protein